MLCIQTVVKVSNILKSSHLFAGEGGKTACRRHQLYRIKQCWSFHWIQWYVYPNYARPCTRLKAFLHGYSHPPISHFGTDFTINQWTFDGKFVKMYSGHTNGVRTMVCLGSAELWTGGDDFSIRIWNIYTGQCTRTLIGHTGSVLALVTTGLSVWSAGEDKTIRSWSVSSGEALNLVTVDTKITSLVQMGKYIWSCGQDPQIHIWNLKSMTLANTLKAKGHSKYINGLLKVSSVLTRSIWSFSLGDQKVIRWRAESNYDIDFAEEASQLQAANTVLDQQYMSLVESNDCLQNCLISERAAYNNQLERLVQILASSSKSTDELANQYNSKVLSKSTHDIMVVEKSPGHLRACKYLVDLERKNGYMRYSLNTV